MQPVQGLRMVGGWHRPFGADEDRNDVGRNGVDVDQSGAAVLGAVHSGGIGLSGPRRTAAAWEADR